jgi:hypothetical protein
VEEEGDMTTKNGTAPRNKKRQTDIKKKSILVDLYAKEC